MAGGLGGKFNPKTIELIIYIAFKLKDKPTYGATLLGKALYFIDSMSYLRTKKPISDLSYIKQAKGPTTPQPSKFLPIRDHLVTKGDLEKIEVDYFGRKQHKFIAKRDPDIKVFNKDEIFLIDEVLDFICEQNATQISDLTHLFDCWQIAEDKEELPFHSFLLNHEEPSAKDLAWAEASIKKYKKSLPKKVSK